MANDEQPPPENGQTNGQADPQQLTFLVQQLTEAIRDLADGRQPPPSTEDEEARARRQRIDFGYRALGTLMGRVSRTNDEEFDVPTFTARWDADRPVIHLYGLSDTVTWVELRAPATGGYPRVEETVKVVRGGRGEPDAAERGHRRPRLEPKRIAHGSAIESMIGLGGPTGPLLALGPRLETLIPESAPAE
jgi:hypothetical protein